MPTKGFSPRCCTIPPWHWGVSPGISAHRMGENIQWDHFCGARNGHEGTAGTYMAISAASRE